MTTAFHNIAVGVHNALKNHRGLAVSYSRGLSSCELTAVPGRTRMAIQDESGLTLYTQERDWLIQAAELVLDGTAVLPETGDRIRLVVGAQALVYEVQPLDAERPYRLCDDLGRVLRVHVRHVATEDA